jgi:hypothetical protein
MQRAWILVGVMGLLGAIGCSKAPPQVTEDTTTDVGRAASPSIVPKDASRQAEKLAAQIDPRPECNVFREQMREAGHGSPAAAATHMAFQEARKAAREAGCLEGQ